jgi:uncharacterized damage-inducible protein DinB
MAIRDALLAEFDHEMVSTRKTLERVPSDKFGWKPHAKSMSMQQLSSHVANIPGWAVFTLKQEALDLSPKDGKSTGTPQASSTKELLELFDKNSKDGRAALAEASDEEMFKSWSLIAEASDEEMFKSWSLMMGEKTLFTMPKVAVLRSFLMNHLIHHRAQLGVYLRLNDVAVPSVYGPSADEQIF